MKLSAKDIVLQHLNSKNIFGYEEQFNVLYGKPNSPCLRVFFLSLIFFMEFNLLQN